jgi:hypothetical protein
MDPQILLPSPFVVRLPCVSCGRAIPVGKPLVDVPHPPSCDTCATDVAPSFPIIHSALAETALPRSMRIARLGFGPGAIFEVSFSDRESAVFRLAGDPLDQFRRFAREPRSTEAPAVTND